MILTGRADYTSSNIKDDVGQCTETVIDGVLGPDVGPSAPDFATRCAFCYSHSWACSDTQNSLCELAHQAQVSNKRFAGQWSRALLNGFIFLPTSGATIAYSMRPLVRIIITSPELMALARALESWRLMAAVAYRLLVMVVLTYATYTLVIAWTTDIFMISSVSYWFYLWYVSGHIVAICWMLV